MTGPATYTHGLGELIRAHRLYMCLNKDDMAARLKMNPRTYDRIENGQRDCPPGLLDSIREVVAAFEADVDALAEADPGTVRVRDGQKDAWLRAVAGRAAVETEGNIVPILVP